MNPRVREFAPVARLDYCSSPLAMDRGALDDYAESVAVVGETVDEAAGWVHIEWLPSLWERVPSDA